MIALAREFRLVPVVVFAATSLLALKCFGLVFEGGYTLGQPRVARAEAASEVAAGALANDVHQDANGDPPKLAPPWVEAPRSEPPKSASQRSWAQEMFGYPDATGSVRGAPKPPAPEAQPDKEAAQPPGKTPGGVSYDPDHAAMSAGERAVLESLNQRRQELEARARALDMRENLLAAAEKRIEGRLAELKELEARINVTLQKKDEAEAARFKGLVTMYENMKAKDAAKIFDRLDMNILVEVATQINPRRMSDIMAQMSPEAAERLTVAMARRSQAPEKPVIEPELPKIEGHPSGS